MIQTVSTLLMLFTITFFVSKIVHRDLAARNILLTDNFTPKIFNFAVSCDVYDPESYNKLAPVSSKHTLHLIPSLKAQCRLLSDVI